MEKVYRLGIDNTFVLIFRSNGIKDTAGENWLRITEWYLTLH